jgi:hypothetical protein
MGLDPRIFGPSFWGALHLACFHADNPDKVRDFINLYQYVLPCQGCRNHFAQVLKDYPIPETNEELFDWSVMVHNVVNDRLGKPRMTTDEAVIQWIGKKLMEFENPQPVQSFPYLPVGILVFLIIILIIIFVKSKK